MKADSETRGWRREHGGDIYQKRIGGLWMNIYRHENGWAVIGNVVHERLSDAKRAAHKHARERKA